MNLFSNFLESKETQDVVPEVYMMSDYSMAMVRDRIFSPKQELKDKVQVKEDDAKQLIPNVLVEAKTTKEIPVEFLLIKVAHGQPRHNKFSILKTYQFPVANRNKPLTRKDLKTHLQRYRNHTAFQRYANFQLLCFLAKEMDVDVSF